MHMSAETNITILDVENAFLQSENNQRIIMAIAVSQAQPRVVPAVYLVLMYTKKGEGVVRQGNGLAISPYHSTATVPVFEGPSRNPDRSAILYHEGEEPRHE